MDFSGADDGCILDKAVQRFYVYVTTWGTWVDGGGHTSLVFNYGLCFNVHCSKVYKKEPTFTCKECGSN